MADFGSGGPNQFGQHNNDDFFASLKELAGNMQKHRVSSMLDDAHQRVQDIKAQMQPGAEQRAALTNTAQDVFTNMMSMGADPAAASLVYQNLTPKSYSTVDSALLSGDPYEMQAASQIQQEQELRTARRDNEKFQFQSAIVDKQQAGAERRAEIMAQRAEARAAKVATPVQTRAAGFAAQLIQANKTFDSIPSDVATDASAGLNALAGGFDIPFTSAHVGFPGLQSARYQQLDQAGEMFINSIARPDGSNRIPEAMKQTYRDMYIPQRGDSKAVVAQKARARAQAVQKTILEAGPAANTVSQLAGGPAALGDNMVDLSTPGAQFKVNVNKYYKPAGSF